VVKGAAAGTHNENPEETARVDLQVLLQTKLMGASGVPVQTPIGKQTYLATYINMTTNPRWSEFDIAFDKTTAEMKGARVLRLLSRGNIFKAIKISNMGLIQSDFSIDLVAAALRQREFAKKITTEANFDTPEALTIACTRYHKFVLLMGRKGKKSSAKKVALVPTLDIDLCWHTHQLFAVSYRVWCIEHLGLAIHHDDTVGKESLDSGLKETSAAWSHAYREPYTNESLNPKGILPFMRRKSAVGKGTFACKRELMVESESGPGYSNMYPYWLNVPDGWKYPASCAASKEKGGWAASVDQQAGNLSFLEVLI
jgi:hypothetical protein